VTVILAAIACKELLGKAIQKGKEKFVQWATERQLRKWQKELQEQMQKGSSKHGEHEIDSGSEDDELHGGNQVNNRTIVRRAREWKLEGGTADFLGD